MAAPHGITFQARGRYDDESRRAIMADVAIFMAEATKSGFNCTAYVHCNGDVEVTVRESALKNG